MASAAQAHKPQPSPQIEARENGCRSRRRRRRLVKTAWFARWTAWCIVPLVLVLLYVGIVVALTAQTYRLNASQRVHAALLERNNALRSREAQLESIGNLEAAARKLHMSEPRKTAFISTPAPPQAARHRFALFVEILGITRWVGVR